MKKFIYGVMASILFVSPVVAEDEQEVYLFPLLDTDKSETISINEFDAFIEKLTMDKIKNMGIFGDIPLDFPNVRLYKDEYLRIMTNSAQKFFEMQDTDHNLVITPEEYNNSILQPLLQIKE